MPLHLEGSCRCRAVRFSIDSHTPYPYQLCYCSICRKTAGGGGFAINIMGDAASLKISGKPALAVYHAEIEADGESKASTAQRHFCRRCGSGLWVFDPAWPDLSDEALASRAPRIPLDAIIGFLDARPDLRALVAPYVSPSSLY